MAGFWDMLQQQADSMSQRVNEAEQRKLALFQMLGNFAQSDADRGMNYLGAKNAGLLQQAGVLGDIENRADSRRQFDEGNKFTAEQNRLNNIAALERAGVEANVDMNKMLTQAELTVAIQRLQETREKIDNLKKKQQSSGGTYMELK